MSKRQTYTKEFKLEVVRSLEESGMNGMEVSRELGARRNRCANGKMLYGLS